MLVRFWSTITQGGPVDVHALAIGAGTLVLVIALRKLARKYKLPQLDMLIALVAATSNRRGFGLVAARPEWQNHLVRSW